MDVSSRTVRVLLVDDEVGVTEAVAAFLERERTHFAVTTVASASAGLDTLATESVDCVVSDYDMPGTDGLGFLDRVRETHGDLPFVLFTGEGSEELASEAIRAGVTDYVRKGTGAEQYALLANRIEQAVEASRSHTVLGERTRRLETLISNLPGIVYRCENDPDWPMEFVAGECEAITGYTAEALERDEVNWSRDVLHPDDREEMWTAVQEALADDEPFEVTYRIRTREGETRWMWERGRGLGGDGDVDALEGIITDVTERRERERRIEAIQRRTRQLIDTQSREETARIAVETAHEVLDAELAGVHLLDAEGTALEPTACVDAVSETLGERPRYDREGDAADELVWDAFERGESVVVDDVRESESDRLAEATPVRSGVVYPLADHGVFVASSTEPRAFDDTERALLEIVAASLTAALDRVEREVRLRERESALETERDRMRALFETVPDPITHVRFEDDEPILLDVNPAFEETFGYTAAEVVGESSNDLIVTPERREEARQIDQQARSEGATSREVRRRTVDGLGDFLFRSVPVGEPDGAEEYFGIYVDISEQKAVERRLERQNERLEEFAEMVSHDLRNPLNVAQGRVELLQDEYDDDHLDAVERAQERMAALVEDILYLARKGGSVGTLEPVRLDELVRGCWDTIETDGARLVVETERTVEADRGQLRRLLENLLGNGVEHGSASPRSSSTRQDAVEHGSTSPRSDARQGAVERGGPGVTVTVGDCDGGFYVADDGPGVDEGSRDRLFEAGYSTSRDGTGFGLRIVAQIADGHGWDVSVTDSESGGARFEVTGVEGA